MITSSTGVKTAPGGSGLVITILLIIRGKTRIGTICRLIRVFIIIPKQPEMSWTAFTMFKHGSCISWKCDKLGRFRWHLPRVSAHVALAHVQRQGTLREEGLHTPLAAVRIVETAGGRYNPLPLGGGAIHGGTLTVGQLGSVSDATQLQ